MILKLQDVDLEFTPAYTTCMSLQEAVNFPLKECSDRIIALAHDNLHIVTMLLVTDQFVVS